jgi:uncharacterized membrane protein YcaP (DUF421 family)
MIGLTVLEAAVRIDVVPVLEAVASTAALYLLLCAALRLLGRRQLGQLTVIDLVVILLLGSAVETAMIHGNTSLPVGLASAATLLILNGLLTRAFLHLPSLSYLVNGGPVLLVNRGRVVNEHLVRVGMTDADLLEALRSRGFEGPDGVRIAVLETDGTVSVVGEASHAPAGSPPDGSPRAGPPPEGSPPAGPPPDGLPPDGAPSDPPP